MSDTVDPFVWTEPASLPDPNLVDFFTSSLPESPQTLQLSPDTPSNSTHPWESEMTTLQQPNTVLLLEQLERQKVQLASSRRKLIAVERDKARLQDRLDRLEHTAKRPRVDNLRCTCAKKRQRACGITELLDRFAIINVPDFAPEVRNFINILEEEKRDQSPDRVTRAVYNCLLRADEERTVRIMSCIAAASIMESATISALVDSILHEVKRGLHDDGEDAISLKDIVRILLQGVLVGVWTKRTAAEVLACFIELRREEGALLRVALSSNQSMVRAVLINNTDGRDLNLLWGPSLQAVLTFFIMKPHDNKLRFELLSHEAFLSRWNDVRTTVEDLQDHASLCDAEKALLLEWSTSTAVMCFDVAVRKALLERVGDMTTESEKMEKMLGLVDSLMTVLKRDETAEMRKCISTVAKWLVCLSCVDVLAPRLAVMAVNMAVELLSVHGREEVQDEELKTRFVRFSQRELTEEVRNLLSKKVMRMIAQLKE